MDRRYVILYLLLTIARYGRNMVWKCAHILFLWANRPTLYNQELQLMLQYILTPSMYVGLAPLFLFHLAAQLVKINSRKLTIVLVREEDSSKYNPGKRPPLPVTIFCTKKNKHVQQI